MDTEYADPRRDEWQTKTLLALKKLPLAKLEEESSLSRRALVDLRAERSGPHAKNMEHLAKIARQYESGDWFYASGKKRMMDNHSAVRFSVLILHYLSNHSRHVLFEFL